MSELHLIVATQHPADFAHWLLDNLEVDFQECAGPVSCRHHLPFHVARTTAARDAFVSDGHQHERGHQGRFPNRVMQADPVFRDQPFDGAQSAPVGGFSVPAKFPCSAGSVGFFSGVPSSDPDSSEMRAISRVKWSSSWR